MDKLREKKQGLFQQNKAAQAVSLYFETQVPDRSPGRAKTTPSIAPARPQSWCRWEDGYVVTSTSPEWDAVIDELATETKTRHYSRKTIKTYALWSRQFQGFLKNKSPGAIWPASRSLAQGLIYYPCTAGMSTASAFERNRRIPWDHIQYLVSFFLGFLGKLPRDGSTDGFLYFESAGRMEETFA